MDEKTEGRWAWPSAPEMASTLPWPPSLPAGLPDLLDQAGPKGKREERKDEHQAGEKDWLKRHSEAAKGGN